MLLSFFLLYVNAAFENRARTNRNILPSCPIFPVSSDVSSFETNVDYSSFETNVDF